MKHFDTHTNIALAGHVWITTLRLGATRLAAPYTELSRVRDWLPGATNPIFTQWQGRHPTQTCHRGSSLFKAGKTMGGCRITLDAIR